MTLRFTFLGYEYASISLDIEHADIPVAGSLIETGVDLMSDWWIKKMMKRGRR